MGDFITNEEMIREMSKEEIFNMWYTAARENSTLKHKIISLNKEILFLRKESENFERLWNSTKVDEQKKEMKKEKE